MVTIHRKAIDYILAGSLTLKDLVLVCMITILRKTSMTTVLYYMFSQYLIDLM
jgi:hypothetical protein